MDIVRKKVISVDSSLAVKDLAKIMEDSSVKCVVVTKRNKKHQ
jgi:predicted transcriptional regulator